MWSGCVGWSPIEKSKIQEADRGAEKVLIATSDLPAPCLVFLLTEMAITGILPLLSAVCARHYIGDSIWLLNHLESALPSLYPPNTLTPVADFEAYSIWHISITEATT